MFWQRNLKAEPSGNDIDGTRRRCQLIAPNFRGAHLHSYATTASRLIFFKCVQNSLKFGFTIDTGTSTVNIINWNWSMLSKLSLSHIWIFRLYVANGRLQKYTFYIKIKALEICFKILSIIICPISNLFRDIRYWKSIILEKKNHFYLGLFVKHLLIMPATIISQKNCNKQICRVSNCIHSKWSYVEYMNILHQS